MKFWRPSISATHFLVILLPVLLGVLATLQYRWLSEISAAEKERLQARLQTDAQRFSRDFNAEITKAYFIFQLDSRVFEPEKSNVLAERFDVWRAKSDFPNIVGEILLAANEKDGKQALRRFNADSRNFENAEWTAEFDSVREKLDKTAEQIEHAPPGFGSQGSLIDENIPALVLPIFELPAEIPSKREDVFVRMSATHHAPRGFVVVKFNADAIKNEMLPAIFRRNFAEQGALYNFAVVKQANPDQIVFQSARVISKPDATAGLFEIAPDSSNILILEAGLPRLRTAEKNDVIFHQRIEQEQIHIAPPERAASNVRRVEIVRSGEKMELRKEKIEKPSAPWLLNVQHADGSLENFVGRAKWRNLGLSFGILTLLGASVILLVLSTHKMKRAAQRQIDFVSSVSHEFRTPVAVISSAGENLADGIVQNSAQIEKYGKLIRREANRLSEMVEQILEFAGARSGRRKYAFQPTEIAPLVEEVLTESLPILEEQGFKVEKKIESDLPAVLADAKALRHALQNLVNNSAKYSNGSRWIKVEAKQESENIVISVADKGIGIDAKELKHIFEPFYRGREVIEAQIHGNGLGLSLVKQIVEAHNGRISVESKPHEGSIFTMRIPLKSES